MFLLFVLKLFTLVIFLVPLGDSSLVQAHHCGPTQPLPEFPRHSCRTHTQTWQPGETVDQHPGGAGGRGTGVNQAANSGQGASLHCQLIRGSCVCGSPGYTGANIPCRPDLAAKPQTPPASCTYYVDPKQIDEMLRARPGVCQRYGSDQIICQANLNTTQSDSGGGSAPQSETWEAKLKRELESEIESQATGSGFDHTRTTLKVTILASGGWRRAGTAGVFSRDYVNLADQVVNKFMNDGRTRPPDRKSHNLTLALSGTPSASSPTAGTPSDGAACPYIPGQILQGKADVKTTVDPNPKPPITGGAEIPVYPPPQSVQTPAIQLVYGRMWWKPGGQNLYFPIDIQVPDSVPSNLDQSGVLSPGPAGQYYTGFTGRLVTKWNPQTGYGGSFRIMQLQPISGQGWETVFEWKNGRRIAGFPVRLGPTPLPPAAPTTNPQ